MEWAVDGDGDEGDVKDESAAYLEFLNEEVGYDNLQSSCRNTANRRTMKAQKFGSVGDDEDDELEEEGLLETPLDKVEPYGLFKDTLMSTPCPPILNLLHLAATASSWLTTTLPTELQHEQPNVYDTLTKILSSEEQQIVQGVIHQAEANAVAAAAAAGAQTNGGSH